MSTTTRAVVAATCLVSVVIIGVLVRAYGWVTLWLLNAVVNEPHQIVGADRAWVYIVWAVYLYGRWLFRLPAAFDKISQGSAR